jgi:hypothetical protein
MHDHPLFGPRLRACLERARHDLTSAQREELAEQIRRAIEPFDVAGLSDRGRRNWYPVEAEDLFGVADKMAASQVEIEKLLRHSVFL